MDHAILIAEMGVSKVFHTVQPSSEGWGVKPA